MSSGFTHPDAEGLQRTDPRTVRTAYLDDNEPFQDYADREGLPTGASSSSMYTGTIGSTRYFGKDLDAMDPYEAASNIAASIALEYLPGDQPATTYDPESGDLLMETAGERAVPHHRRAEGFLETVKAAIHGHEDPDTDSFYTAVATHAILHNPDISGNILIDTADTEPQQISPIDFDFAGHAELDRPHLDGYENRAREQATGFDIGFDTTTFYTRLEDMAAATDTTAMYDDLDDITDEIDDPRIRDQTEAYLDNIVTTIEWLRDRSGQA